MDLFPPRCILQYSNTNERVLLYKIFYGKIHLILQEKFNIVYIDGCFITSDQDQIRLDQMTGGKKTYIGNLIYRGFL